jgi:NAD(P)-dependent dehydrogenase (short-subunit alcohol dehydrogenase family)
VLLDERNAVIYGGGGSIGGAVARAFAREGARVFLAGRTRATVEHVAEEIVAGGGSAEAAQVDALDEDAVDRHADAVVEAAGSLDVSFNAIGHGDVHGTPLIDMPAELFARPVQVAVRSQFLTTRAAARHMIRQGSGVILAITAATSHLAIPEIGGTGVAFDAIESQSRQWAAELGPLGVRVVWLQTTGIPETLHPEAGQQPAYGTGGPMTPQEHIAWMLRGTMLKRLTSLVDVGDAAAFLVSDRAAAMTATGVNLTAGTVGTR